MNPLAKHSLDGKVALVTGSSRGIGADTVGFLADAGAKVIVNYRNKESRAHKIVEGIKVNGGEAIAVGADLTDSAAVRHMFDEAEATFGKLDILVMNASGGMESGMEADYAMKLNRDAQANLLKTALSHMNDGSRVVFVTSHQAHFIVNTPTMQNYAPVAYSKRAGEDALREMIPALEQRNIGFVVVSGDMIAGTITASLLERSNPGAIESRRESAGKLYNVSEFAAEIVLAAVEDVPADNTRLVGNTSDFR